MANVLEQQNNSIDDYSNDDLDEGLDFDNTEIVVVVVVYSFIIKRRSPTTHNVEIAEILSHTFFAKISWKQLSYKKITWNQ